MSEDSRAPPEKRKSRPGQAASFEMGNNNSPIISRFGDPAQPLAELRELNRRRARITALVPRVHRLGSRPTAELVLEAAVRLDGFGVIEELAERYCARLDPVLLHVTGGDRFPPSPLRLVATAPISVAAGRKR